MKYQAPIMSAEDIREALLSAGAVAIFAKRTSPHAVVDAIWPSASS